MEASILHQCLSQKLKKKKLQNYSRKNAILILTIFDTTTEIKKISLGIRRKDKRTYLQITLSRVLL